MRKIRTIVVEDELLPKLTLLQKLERLKEHVEVVDDCDCFEDARKSIARNRPDLVILDIQLREKDSIVLLKELQEEMELPYIIFTTAYDYRQYLMSAIKLQAVDYLLKPIGLTELTKAIGKVAERLQNAHQPSGTPVQRLSFRTSKGLLMIDASEIAYLKAARNYAVMVRFREEEMLLESLSVLERQLSPGDFIRIDRSTIVNRQNIYRVNKHAATCIFRSTDHDEVTLKLTKVGLDKLLHQL